MEPFPLCAQVPAQSYDAIAALVNVATMVAPFLKHFVSLRITFEIRWWLATIMNTARSEATASSCELLWVDPWVSPHLSAQVLYSVEDSPVNPRPSRGLLAEPPPRPIEWTRIPFWECVRRTT